MFRTRGALFGVLALSIVGGIAAPTASAVGPYWHVSGSRLESGIKQLKLQAKGTSILYSPVAGIPVILECRSSTAEGAAIEGNHEHQGQGKLRLLFSQCKIPIPFCGIREPVATSQLKVHLVTIKGSQSNYAELFEQQQGNAFVIYKFFNESEQARCLILGEDAAHGTVAAEVMPAETEGQEDLLRFPEVPISKVLLEEKEKEVGLLFGTTQLKMSAVYGQRLNSTEKFGVFGK